MRIIADDNIPFLRGRLEPHAEVEYTDQFGFTPENVRDTDALLIRTRTRCDRALLEGSRVKHISTATIGMDQIDLEWCEAHGISVSNAPGCNAPGVAQYVWSALLRMGFNPKRGDRLGVVGRGNVGSIVAEWGERLGAEVIVSDPPRQRRGISDNYAELSELMEHCDAVTLHTPLTKQGPDPTWHLIGENELKKMRKGAILVNAARGPVVDFGAMTPLVKSGAIRAAIDTWEWEPEVDEELLTAVEYGTFHIAGYSRQGKERATRMALEALGKRFGIDIDTTGLEGPYGDWDGISEEAILASYDPAEDTRALREAPSTFDTLRRNYNYREEVVL